MKFGNYKIDSFWLIMIIGFLATSIFFPFMLLSVIIEYFDYELISNYYANLNPIIEGFLQS